MAAEVYGIGVGDLAYQGITLAFDFHVEDLWVPLIAGATLIAGKSAQGLFGEDLHAFLLERKVTVLPCVPTLWATLESDLPDIRVVLLSGENVPQHLVARWHREGRTILNAYGPTECSVSSTLRVLEPHRPVTIGCPLPTYTVVILDEHEDGVVAVGEVGEIGIAGVALARATSIVPTSRLRSSSRTSSTCRTTPRSASTAPATTAASARTESSTSSDGSTPR